MKRQKFLLPVCFLMFCVLSCEVKSKESSKATVDTIHSSSAKKSETVTPKQEREVIDTPKVKNTLTRADIIFSTPEWGDGKNMNSSIIAGTVVLTMNSGEKIVGNGELRDGTEIRPGIDWGMGLSFKNPELIEFDSIKTIGLNLTMYKPDQMPDAREDEWDFRREVLLTFKDQKIISTGYNDPPLHIKFPKFAHRGEFVDNYSKTQFKYKRTLLPPFK
jgi:hypothetical protein